MIEPHDSVIVRTLGRIVIPVAQLFGCYVLIFGQYGPGGGFVGGVILAASMILAILIFGLDSEDSRLARAVLHGDGLGLLIFAGVGGLCLIGGGQFLNYADLQVPGLDEASRRYLGILLTQIGVAVDVAVTGASISISLSSEDDTAAQDEDAHV
jgi:multicomponent Na+:H+ antiporter subunit B